ncbi:MAG: hypothetical protein WD407_06320 [Rhodospirillales bacterium]
MIQQSPMDDLRAHLVDAPDIAAPHFRTERIRQRHGLDLSVNTRAGFLDRDRRHGSIPHC